MNKKAQSEGGGGLVSAKLIIVVLVALVVISMFIIMYRMGILDKIRDVIPGFDVRRGNGGGNGDKILVSIEWEKGKPLLKGFLEFSDLGCKITFENNEGIYEYPKSGNSAGRLTVWSSDRFVDDESYVLNDAENAKYEREVFEELNKALKDSKSKVVTTLFSDGKSRALSVYEVYAGGSSDYYFAKARQILNEASITIRGTEYRLDLEKANEESSQLIIFGVKDRKIPYGFVKPPETASDAITADLFYKFDENKGKWEISSGFCRYNLDECLKATAIKRFFRENC